ncbi:MAG: biopolymer transporter ExbD [Leptospiraceae bacterium]|nr:biopolymer transporter ExbD [Leptospiraceae bacterium]
MQIRKRRQGTSIPLAAMGDIAFLLLVFYMATTMVTDQKPRDVDVPGAEAPSQSSPFPLIIYVDRELGAREQAFFFNEVVSISRLPGLVQDRANQAPGPVRVYLSISRDLPYRTMDSVIQRLKDAGIANLVITTREGGSSD